MADYSLIKGICLDIVLDNRESKNTESIIKRDYFFNVVTVKIIITGLMIVNAVFLVLQIGQLIYCCITPGTERLLGDMHRIFPILACICLNLFFMLISSWIIDLDKGKNRLLIHMFILSVLGNIVLLIVGYIIKIFNYGVSASNLTGAGITIAYMVIVLVGWQCLALGKEEFLRRIAIWGVLLLSGIQILPTEYLVSNINVIVFMNKYDHGLIGECVEQKDIDMQFLFTMGLDAVPAMTDLLDKEIMYESTGMSLGEVTENYIVEMFYRDLSSEDRKFIEGAADERLEVLLDILGQKAEYKVIGKRYLAYKALRDAAGSDY